MQSKTEQAIEILLESSQKNTWYNLYDYDNVVLQSSAYHNYTEYLDQQRITQADYDLQRGKIVKVLQQYYGHFL